MSTDPRHLTDREIDYAERYHANTGQRGDLLPWIREVQRLRRLAGQAVARIAHRDAIGRGQGDYTRCAACAQLTDFSEAELTAKGWLVIDGPEDG